jgi:hypothetical protein
VIGQPGEQPIEASASVGHVAALFSINAMGWRPAAATMIAGSRAIARGVSRHRTRHVRSTRIRPIGRAAPES